MSEKNKPEEEMISMEGAKLVEDKPAYTWYGKEKTKPRHTPYVPPDYHRRPYQRDDDGSLSSVFIFVGILGFLMFMIWLSTVGK